MTPVLPPATIGIIGGGQLGMMTVREAHRMGYQTLVWDPDPRCPASRLCDSLITAPFDDRKAGERIAGESDVVTYEFENVETEIVELVEKSKEVFPGSKVLRVSQHRQLEKEELRRRGFPTVDFLAAESSARLRSVVERMKLPMVLKTARLGYDGKGQTVIVTEEEKRAYLETLGEMGETVVEEFIDLRCEISVIAARSMDGSVVTFPVCENIHHENILHMTFVPARVDERIQQEAVSLARGIIESFQLVGLLCVEFFVTRHGRVLVNEIAPRPHNSGHFSLDACSVSQFEALVRTICSLELETPRLLSPCAMINLLGQDLERLDVEALHRLPGVKLHLYGKTGPRPKRKMGHVTVLQHSQKEVERIISVIEEMISEEEPQTRDVLTR